MQSDKDQLNVDKLIKIRQLGTKIGLSLIKSFLGKLINQHLIQGFINIAKTAQRQISLETNQ